MKKAILGTTALVAVGVLAIGTASASDKIKLGVGGYMQSTYYYANYDQDTNSAGTNERISDRVTYEGEVHFTGETTLDNGIKFGANIQLEAYATSDQIDETYVYADGAFGRVLFGSEDGAAYLMHYAAPSPVPMYGADSPNIYPIGVTATTFATMYADKDKISYFTPRFAGFQLGVSYIPDGSSETGQHSAYAPTQFESGIDRGYSVGLNYVNKLGAVDLAVSAGYNRADVRITAPAPAVDGEDMSEYNFGAQVGIAGFTIGGGYSKTSDIGGVAGVDSKAWSAGATYGMGPWKVGVQYSDRDDDAGGDLKNWVIGGQYALGPGITAFGGVELYDNSLAAGGIQGDSQIYFVGTALSF
ncbi:porin [Sneathiella sp.]|uniref:porin n=1 Tax=Sneathiella sp. TaxID=1964365 RepID=UPI003569AD8D